MTYVDFVVTKPLPDKIHDFGVYFREKNIPKRNH